MAHWWRRLIRFGFRLLYNEFAWIYDLVSWVVSLGEWRSWQRAGLPYITGRDVLEIAHGPGHMLLALAEAGHCVVGCDVSVAMGRQAQRRLSRARVHVPLVRGEVQTLPFKPASFDSVFSTFPAEFILEAGTWQAVYKTLRPGGRLVVVPGGHLSGRGLFHRFLNWLFVITGQREATDEPSSATNAAPVWDKLQRPAEAAGFQARMEIIDLKRSVVLVIVADKPG